MSSHIPPVPPANRSNKGEKSDTEVSKDPKLVKHEHHANSAEEGDTANIKQNTTNKGFFRGRRLGCVTIVGLAAVVPRVAVCSGIQGPG
jgi:hypothetical protein